MNNDVVDILKAAVLIVTIIGLPVAVRQLWHRRTANFVAAWKQLRDELQDENVRMGRALCGELNSSNKAHLPRVEFPTDWEQVCAPIRDGYPEDTRLRNLDRKQLKALVKDAYDAFDLAAILAWHSKIPGLWNAVVAEWQDGIINTWEAGAPLLKDRELLSRTEQYECFSALYVSAVHYNKVGRGWYPYRGPIRILFRSQPRWLIALKARQRRKEVLGRSRGSGHPTN